MIALPPDPVDKAFNEHTEHPMKHEPTGTNLFDAEQATAMVRYMVEGLVPEAAPAGGRVAEGWVPTHRHKKRGTECMILGNAFLQTDKPLSDMTPMIVYRDQDGSLWVRSGLEFNDGRFEPIPVPPSTTGSGEG